jgi:alkylation response protein AidB-like acyl-CoA dehydrogenase
MSDTDEIAQMLCQSAEDFVSAHSDLDLQRQSLGQPLLIDRQRWQAMAELGWLGLSIPESMCGSGMGVNVAAPLCEVLGRRLFSSPYIAAALQPAAVIGAMDGDAAVAMAEGLVSGERLFCLAWQETTDSLGRAMPEARVEGNHLSGHKVFVTGLEQDSIVLVYARQAGKPVLVAVDAGADGISIKRNATAHGSYSEVRFDKVELRGDGAPLLAGAAASASLHKAISMSRVAASAQLAGIARGCLEQTVEYVNQRVQFGRPIGAFQSVKHRCVDLRIGVEMAEASWREAAARLTEAGGTDHPSVYAAKARCSDVARRVGKDAVQLHGAMGFTEECDVGLFLRAALQYSSWLGSPVAMRRHFMTLASNDVAPAEGSHV